MADKLVGRAAALLAMYAQIRSVYASTIGVEAARLLEQHGIPYSYGSMVAKVMNKAGTDICPFEKAVSGTVDPGEAYRLLRGLLFQSKAINI